MWKSGNSAYSNRYERIRQLRKSERIRLLELEVVRLNFELQYTQVLISALIENNSNIKVPEMDLDAGKWYNRKPKND